LESIRERRVVTVRYKSQCRSILQRDEAE
jgi:hypothetical protein